MNTLLLPRQWRGCLKIDVEDWHNRLSGLLHRRETALLSPWKINHLEFSLQLLSHRTKQTRRKSLMQKHPFLKVTAQSVVVSAFSSLVVSEETIWNLSLGSQLSEEGHSLTTKSSTRLQWEITKTFKCIINRAHKLTSLIMNATLRWERFMKLKCWSQRSGVGCVGGGIFCCGGWTTEIYVGEKCMFSGSAPNQTYYLSVCPPLHSLNHLFTVSNSLTCLPCRDLREHALALPLRGRMRSWCWR